MTDQKHKWWGTTLIVRWSQLMVDLLVTANVFNKVKHGSVIGGCQNAKEQVHDISTCNRLAL